MAYKKVTSADPTQSIVTGADKDIAKAEGEMMKEAAFDPVTRGIQVIDDSLSMAKTLETGQEMIADSDFLEKDEDGNFVKEPRTKFGKKFQKGLKEFVGPSTQEQMATETATTADIMNQRMIDTEKSLEKQIENIAQDPKYSPFESQYYMAISEWMQSWGDGRTPITYDEDGNITGGGEAISPDSFWDWIKTQDKYKDLPDNPYKQEIAQPKSNQISMNYEDIRQEHENYYGNTIGSNPVLAERHLSRSLNKMNIFDENISEFQFNNMLSSDERLQQLVTDGAVAYYSNLTGGKPVSQHTLNRLNKGSLI